MYDNQRGDVTHDDVMIRVTPGMAHISNTPFSKNGMWGWGWRPNREFVGKVSYGVRYKLWNPNKMTASQFPKCFQNTAVTLLMCHNRKECALYRLPHAVILFVLNMMPWNWNGELSDEEKPQTKAKPQYSVEDSASTTTTVVTSVCYCAISVGAWCGVINAHTSTGIVAAWLASTT